MGLRIKTNVSSLNAQRRLESSTKSVNDSMGKLSSGERINKAADDAAGLAVSENLRASVRSLNVAKRNASDGVSLVQTAEGGLVETSSMLIRLRELAIQSSSDTIGDKERAFVDKEFVALKDEIDRIAMSTEFNGTRLLVGETPLTDELGKTQAGFPLEIQISKDYYTNADSETNRNPVNVIQIDFAKINAFTHGDGSLGLGEGNDGSRVDTKRNAQSTISTIDDALSKVNEQRSYLGSIQNRLNSTINNLSVQSENLSESYSRIRDTDFALETANLTKNNILQQAGVSILAQANVSSQIALSLLK